MQKSSKLLVLTRALPVALMLAGSSPPAFAFEHNAAHTIGSIGDQMSRGFLHAAQETLQQLRSCHVHAFQLGDNIVPLHAIELALTGLAKGDASLWLELQDTVHLANAGVRSLFITDVGPVSDCRVETEDTTFVASSSGVI